ncbi:hypothetical protein BVRB_7g163630 [Beta vulgaris subsp. vulgaris]|uniref:uncharacterized protein LOC104898923 n=1 Tax=Beta vulgaris subsp. vulgaris TaxID=3555 RepID=UPI00053F44FC|nr:uncharacterized protein LOC104898923 [Beta vulgaris subsp. vulgaris]KMT06034.1 hypothetical protein BVRB_7g163630 [Beta vulgaris subsp. vulgaris]
MASSIVLLFSLLTFLSLSSITTADDKLSAYDALQTFNFPMGILPKGALGYDLNERNGNFKAFLNGSCSFSLEGSYQLKYKSTISGVISKNKLTNLSGVTVKVFFLWLNIVEVRRVGDELEFSVGIASANFPIDNFYECPQCGCGLDCDNRLQNDQVSSI